MVTWQPTVSAQLPRHPPRAPPTVSSAGVIPAQGDACEPRQASPQVRSRRHLEAGAPTAPACSLRLLEHTRVTRVHWSLCRLRKKPVPWSRGRQTQGTDSGLLRPRLSARGSASGRRAGPLQTGRGAGPLQTGCLPLPDVPRSAVFLMRTVKGRERSVSPSMI